MTKMMPAVALLLATSSQSAKHRAQSMVPVGSRLPEPLEHPVAVSGPVDSPGLRTIAAAVPARNADARQDNRAHTTRRAARMEVSRGVGTRRRRIVCPIAPQ